MVRLQSQSHLFCNFAFVHFYFTLSHFSRSHDAFFAFCEATQQTLCPSFIFSSLFSPTICHSHPMLSTVSSAPRDAAETTHHPGFCGRAGVWTAAQLRDLHHGLGELRRPSSAHTKPTTAQPWQRMDWKRWGSLPHSDCLISLFWLCTWRQVRSFGFSCGWIHSSQKAVFKMCT